MFLMDAPVRRKVPEDKESRGCLCCPWPPPTEIPENTRAPVFYENAPPSEPKARARTQSSEENIPSEQPVQAVLPQASTPQVGSAASLLGSTPPSTGSFGVSPARYDGPPLPEELLQSSMVVRQPEGLTLMLSGSHLLAEPQEAVLEVKMMEGRAQVLLHALVGEKGSDKGIMIRSVQHYMIAYL